MIRIARAVSATHSEGPGLRAALWVQGCQIRCPGCCNPEMFDETAGEVWSVEQTSAWLARARSDHGVEGLTLLGGEPFEQALGLSRLARWARQQELGVMAFTGFTLEALRAASRPGVSELLAAIDVLVDGPYVQRLRSGARPWIGSNNQRLHFLTDRYRGNPAFSRLGTQSVTISFQDDEMSVSGWPWLAAGVASSGDD